eukprot:Gregarina_sp_Pseudo_9__48@NODE_1030_length_1956_cov_20_313511_g966_i0_p4_GENE_NODE_1030_length_1956_cov_20_313511_g966_i0NODE_1030_length_1956_cov_20_313511_g966_i0_p4_ORF_typecomplete_len100_score8_90TcpE/PF12648_7/0_066DinB/PF05163_12/0_19_NODE_1030_length_1956_cov_20_313511_g966_i012431542
MRANQHPVQRAVGARCRRGCVGTRAGRRRRARPRSRRLGGRQHLADFVTDLINCFLGVLQPRLRTAFNKIGDGKRQTAYLIQILRFLFEHVTEHCGVAN